jgi:hypothetical protein
MSFSLRMKICFIALSTCIFVFPLCACTKQDSKSVQEKKGAQSQITTRAREGVVTVSKAEQEASGIVTAPLESVLRRQEIRAYGAVMDLQGLFTLRGKFAEAQAQVDKTRANLDTSRKAYERLKTLYGEGQDVSAKALQAAEAAWRSDAADARAAQQSLETVKATVLQQWGGTLASWVSEASPELDRLYRQDEILIRLTVPPDAASGPPPPTALVQGALEKLETARFISASPRTDPRIQGRSFFYIAPARGAGLLPGMNVLAYLPSGPKVRGIIIPAAAVVWWQGSAWVYVQTGPDRFVRREVSAGTPLKEGLFVMKGFSAEEPVVLSGAQLLLSKEFLSVRPKEEEED